MKLSVLTFVAIYGVVIGTSSCSTGSTAPPSGLGTGTTTAAYQQIERLGRPAVKELFQQFASHDDTNRTEPWALPYSGQSLYTAIGTFDTTVAARSSAHAATLQSILIPDEIAADLSQTGSAAYLGVETKGATGGTFGGRKLSDDVIDISLGAVFGPTLSALALVADDNKESPCLQTDNVPSQNTKDNVTPATFPYVGAPH